MSLPSGPLSISTVILPASAHYLQFSASLRNSARHGLKVFWDWRFPWEVRDVGRQKRSFLVCWKAGEEHAKSERDGRTGSLQGTWRQGVGETNSSLLWMLKGTSAFRALTANPEPSLQAWVCLLWREPKLYRNVISDGSLSVLTQLQSLAPGESSLGAHLKITALHYHVQQGRAARRDPCCETESAGGSPWEQSKWMCWEESMQDREKKGTQSVGV